MQVQACTVALIVASCAELAAAARFCDKIKDLPFQECDGSRLFAVIVGGVSLGFNVIFGVGLYLRQEQFKAFSAYLAVVMVLLWGFGVAVCTFSEPFKITGNGYFATWAAAVTSVYFAQISFSKFNAILGKAFTGALAGSLERRIMMIVMIFSYVCAFASLTDNTYPGFHKNEKWGFACGITCGGLITVFMILKAFTSMVDGPKGTTYVKYLSYFLVIMWLFGVGVLTFDGPFELTSNGYFTAWGSFLSSIYLAYVTTMNPTSETPAN